MARIKNLSIIESHEDKHSIVYPTWTFDESIETTKEFQIMWAYTNGDTTNGQPIWYHAKDATTYSIPTAATEDIRFDPPESSIEIRVQVRAMAKTRKINDVDTPYWTCDWAMKSQYSSEVIYPEAPSAPSVSVKNSILTATLNVDESDSNWRQIEAVKFELYNGSKFENQEIVEFDRKDVVHHVSCQFRLAIGGEYSVRAYLGRNYPGIPHLVWSEPSPFSSPVGTAPAAPSGFTTIRAASSTSVYLAWNAVATADTYDIEYTTNPDYFEGSNATTIKTGIQTTKYTLTGLESGDEYYFRVRAVNDNGNSEWSGIKSVIIGKKPAAPTTWSSTTTAIVGEPLNLYWVHNSEDGSWASYSQIELYFNDVKETHTIENQQKEDEDSDDAEKAHVYAVDTSKYPEGTNIKWRVRTSGITKEFGDWSIQREVNVFARPSLYLTVTNILGNPFEVLDQFPIHVEGYAEPRTQEPIGYHVSIVSKTTYDTVDSIGRPITVRAGDTIMLRYIDSKDPLDIKISASDVDFAAGQQYMLRVVVSMNSGLTAEASKLFTVEWTDEVYDPDAGITVDYTDYTVCLTPHCWDANGDPIPGLLLSVYRREFDGSYTEIATGIDSESTTLVTDPHPALDFARYRIVATSKSTGAVSYYDMPAYPIKGNEVIIQWDEEWQNLDTDNPDRSLTPTWSGSMLKIKGNIDVSDNVIPQATLVNYIGRTYPVSYYGTAIDSTSNWKMDVPKSDKDTLYALRRLQTWKGDVYVREPSGSGYWANIAISFSQTHKNLVIPVSLDITRVEGGM